MIRSYTDHSANERTFLAGLRTGIAVIAFGFLIERFDLFVYAMIAADRDHPMRAELETLSHSYDRGVGHAFVLVGIVFILVSTVRFVRTGWLLDDQKIHAPGIVVDLSLSVVLAVLLIAVSVPLILPSF